MPTIAVRSSAQKAAENHITAVQQAGGPFVTAAQHTRMPMLFSDPHLPGNPIVYVNDSFLELTGYDRDEVLGQNYHFLMGAETNPDARAQIEAAFQSRSYGGYPEVRYYRKDHSSFWAVVFIGPVLDANGDIAQHFISFVDVTDRRKEERRLRLLLHELNHRTQNTLATVQAIAVQTLSGKVNEDALEAFESRILALSEAHRLLGRENWDGATLSAVIRVILEPYSFKDGRAVRYSIEGEEVLLPPRVVLTLALLFQELATNAAKYGAFRNETGHVHISWQVEPSEGDKQQVRLHWRESGGPPVSPPHRSGFGSLLIESELAKQLKGDVHLNYDPAGVICEIVLPYPEQSPEMSDD